MAGYIGWVLAGISTTAFVILWFVTAKKELSEAWQNVEGAMRQVELHKDTNKQARDGPYEKAALGALETSRIICRDAVKNYEHIRRKPMNRIPAYMMGYRTIPKEGAP